MKHVKGLDGLRAVAVSMVLIQHYFFNYYLEKSNEIGGAGVSIFFVISGFLITSILLKQRDKSEPLRFKFSSFYVRRFMRIVPIFYIVIAIGVYCNLYWFTEISYLWHVFYATNIYIYITQNWVGYVGHFWSLDVEEQFYLFWPAIILLTPKNRIIHVIVMTFMLGTLFTPLTSLFGMAGRKFYTLPFTHLDTLAAGAMLGWAVYNDKLGFISRSFVSCMILLSATSVAVCYVASQIFESLKNYGGNTQLMYLSLTLFSVSVVYHLYKYDDSILKRFLEIKPIAGLGKISYAFYLFHNLVPEIFVGTRFTPVSSHSLVNVVVWTLTSITLATISWMLIEKPILSQKDRVEGIFKFALGKRAAC